MGGQAEDPAQRVLVGVAGLDGEPLVDHQRLVLPALVEVGQRRRRTPRRRSASGPRGRPWRRSCWRRRGSGRWRAARRSALRVGGQQLQGGVAQRPAAGAARRRARSRRSPAAAVQAAQLVAQMDRQPRPAAPRAPRGWPPDRPGVAITARSDSLGRASISALKAGSADWSSRARPRASAKRSSPTSSGRPAARARIRSRARLLAGLPAVEQVRVGGQQHVAVLGRGVGGEVHRGGEAAQGREHRRARARPRAAAAARANRARSRLASSRIEAGAAVLVQQADRDRDRQRRACPAGRGSGGWSAPGSGPAPWRPRRSWPRGAPSACRPARTRRRRPTGRGRRPRRSTG